MAPGSGPQRHVETILPTHERRASVRNVLADIVSGRKPTTPWGTRDSKMHMFRLAEAAVGGIFSDHGDFPSGVPVQHSLKQYLGCEPLTSYLVSTQTTDGRTVEVEVFDNMPDPSNRPKKCLTFCFVPGMTSLAEYLFAPHMRAILETAKEEGVIVRLVALNLLAHGRSSNLNPDTLGGDDVAKLNELARILIDVMQRVGIEECVISAISAGYIVPMRIINERIQHPRMTHLVAQSTATGQPGMVLGALGMKPAFKLLEYFEKKQIFDSRLALLGLLSFCGRDADRSIINTFLAQFSDSERTRDVLALFKLVGAYRIVGKMMRRHEVVDPSIRMYHAAGKKDVATPWLSVLAHSLLLRRAGFTETFLYSPAGRHISMGDEFDVVYEQLREIVRARNGITSLVDELLVLGSLTSQPET